MAFSLGAVAGGVGETLDKLLAERRAEALARQQAEAQQAERAFRDRQLAQQLQIAQMRDARDRAEANATAAGKQLAAIRTRYTNTGKQLEQRFGPGALVPRDVAEPVMGAYDVLTEAGDMPIAPPLTQSAIQAEKIAPTLATGPVTPTAVPAEAVAAGTAQMPPESPQPATVPVRRVSAGTLAEPMFTRTPTAEEQRTDARKAALAAYYGDITAASSRENPRDQLNALLDINTRLAQQGDPDVRKDVMDLITPLISDARRVIAEERQSERQRDADARFAKMLTATRDRQDAASIMRLYDDYRSDRRIQGAETAETAKTITAAIDAGSVTPFDRLSLMYAFIRIADNYQTGVRNEEIKMMALPMSDVSKLKLRAEAIVNGNQIVDDKTIRDIASATKRLIAPIDTLAQRRRAEFMRAADAVGIGDAFARIIGTGGGGDGSDALLDELLKE